MAVNGEDFLSKLPTELAILILANLTDEQLFNVQMVNKRLYSIVHSILFEYRDSYQANRYRRQQFEYLLLPRYDFLLSPLAYASNEKLYKRVVSSDIMPISIRIRLLEKLIEKKIIKVFPNVFEYMLPKLALTDKIYDVANLLITAVAAGVLPNQALLDFSSTVVKLPFNYYYKDVLINTYDKLVDFLAIENKIIIFNKLLNSNLFGLGEVVLEKIANSLFETKLGAINYISERFISGSIRGQLTKKVVLDNNLADSLALKLQDGFKNGSVRKYDYMVGVQSYLLENLGGTVKKGFLNDCFALYLDDLKNSSNWLCKLTPNKAFNKMLHNLSSEQLRVLLKQYFVILDKPYSEHKKHIIYTINKLINIHGLYFISQEDMKLILTASKKHITEKDPYFINNYEVSGYELLLNILPMLGDDEIKAVENFTAMRLAIQCKSANKYIRWNDSQCMILFKDNIVAALSARKYVKIVLKLIIEHYKKKYNDSREDFFEIEEASELFPVFFQILKTRKLDPKEFKTIFSFLMINIEKINIDLRNSLFEFIVKNGYFVDFANAIKLHSMVSQAQVKFIVDGIKNGLVNKKLKVFQYGGFVIPILKDKELCRELYKITRYGKYSDVSNMGRVLKQILDNRWYDILEDDIGELLSSIIKSYAEDEKMLLYRLMMKYYDPAKISLVEFINYHTEYHQLNCNKFKNKVLNIIKHASKIMQQSMCNELLELNDAQYLVYKTKLMALLDITPEKTFIEQIFKLLVNANSNIKLRATESLYNIRKFLTTEDLSTLFSLLLNRDLLLNYKFKRYASRMVAYVIQDDKYLLSIKDIRTIYKEKIDTVAILNYISNNYDKFSKTDRISLVFSVGMLRLPEDFIIKVFDENKRIQLRIINKLMNADTNEGQHSNLNIKLLNKLILRLEKNDMRKVFSRLEKLRLCMSKEEFPNLLFSFLPVVKCNDELDKFDFSRVFRPVVKTS